MKCKWRETATKINAMIYVLEYIGVVKWMNSGWSGPRFVWQTNIVSHSSHSWTWQSSICSSHRRGERIEYLINESLFSLQWAWNAVALQYINWHSIDLGYYHAVLRRQDETILIMQRYAQEWSAKRATRIEMGDLRIRLFVPVRWVGSRTLSMKFIEVSIWYPW